MEQTSFQAIESIFQTQQSAVLNERITAVEERLAKLEAVKRLLLENETEIQKAIFADFRKPATEVVLTEIMPILQEIKHLKAILTLAMKAKKQKNKFPFWGTKAVVQLQPKGVVLIISPWNYPLQLCLLPLVGALAAGNRVVLKPSELTPNTSQLIASLLQNTFHEKDVFVANGGLEVSEKLLSLPFDQVFFTGSTKVGKLVHKARAGMFADLVLELGGKSPVWIDNSAVNQANAKKIMWGKCLNAGQTCIAPDYVLCTQNNVVALASMLTKAIEQLYPNGFATDYAAIITEKHTERLVALVQDAIDKGAILHGNFAFDIGNKFFQPLVISNVNKDMLLMQEEIFGPILPIIVVENELDAIHFIKYNAPNPLACYVFSKHKSALFRWMQNVNAGGFCQNDVLVHLAQQNLPFGGVKESGLGQYHGKYSLQTFSRPVAGFQQSNMAVSSFIYPPYNTVTKKIIRLINKIVG